MKKINLYWIGGLICVFITHINYDPAMAVLVGIGWIFSYKIFN